MTQDKEFDIIIWGATGFTGKLVAEHIFNKYGANQSVKWAMAGRNLNKLKTIRAEIADENIPLIVANSNDEISLNDMVRRTKVVCTTVGPYAQYGSKLVAACIENQVHYCDLTGEVQWMRKMIDQHHEAAKANGTKIVFTCGFDSIPSDLGVYFVQQAAKKKTGKPAKQVRMRVAGMNGGLSGGTFASLDNVMKEAAKDKAIYKVLVNPYGLNPEGEQSGNDQRDLSKVVYDEATGNWIFPFIMAGINTKVVRRSNALSDYNYGKDFQYDEAMVGGKGFGGKIKAYLSGAVLGLFFAGKEGGFLKKLINQVLPKPGEGPNKEKREAGFYKFNFFTTLADNTEILGVVTGDKDPGYGSTCKMLTESAICLAQDDLPNIGGCLTPSTAMGDKLLKRLELNAGLTFSIK